jgi:phytoene desaturase
MGGMYRIIESLVSIAEANGARFIFNTPVKRIAVDNGRANGVILEDGSQIKADVVVANADLPYVYRNLLPDKAPADRLDRMKYTCSAITFYWGVDKVYPQLDTHNLFVAGDYRASINRVFKDKSLPDEPNFYVHAPTRIDPSAALKGSDTLMVLVPAGRLKEKTEQDWDLFRTQARSAVLERLAELGMADLEDQIKFEVSYSPRTYKRMYNLAKGAAFGSINHNLLQVGYLRPHNRHHRYRNLFFTGGSTHPGNGLPLVLLSAKLTSERILNEIGIPQLQRGFEFMPIGVPAKSVVYEEG